MSVTTPKRRTTATCALAATSRRAPTTDTARTLMSSRLARALTPLAGEGGVLAVCPARGRDQLRLGKAAGAPHLRHDQHVVDLFDERHGRLAAAGQAAGGDAFEHQRGSHDGEG